MTINPEKVHGLLFILLTFAVGACNLSHKNFKGTTQTVEDVAEFKGTPYTINDIHTLSNKYVSASFKTKGAEMISFKTDTLEYIWQADPEVWPRHAPILFPIVGRLKDHEYTYGGTSYPMKQHGFARDYDFKVIKKDSTAITFEQTATPQTKEIFPFDYILQVKYALVGKSLITQYVVKNPSKEKELYFSIGAHPAFNVPFKEGQKRKEYVLEFDKKVSPQAQINKNGLYEGDSLEVFERLGVLPVSDTLFDRGSLTFNPNPFSGVTFVHRPTGKEYLHITFEDFPYLGVWSPRDTPPFVCIEPWYGIADRKAHNKDFTKKKGIIELVPDSEFECAFTIEIL